MSILKNAIDSIQIGVEDYIMEDERRSISAVRNISAGILLLYKEKLCQLSPDHDKELLIKKDLRPIQSGNGEIAFEGKGKKTVDVQSIKERFSSLNVKVEWKRFDEINQLRNDLEHYFTDKSPDAVKEIVSKSFLLIRDFITNELEEDPKEIIGNETWISLLKVAEVYTAEEKICKESIQKIDWEYSTVESAIDYARCPECHSSLVQAQDENDAFPQVGLSCRSCSAEFSYGEIIEQCISDFLGADAYYAAKEGERPPYETCNECQSTTYVHEESCCVSCGYELEYTECEDCQEPLQLEDQWLEGKCGYCNNRWEKFMAE